MNSTQHSQRFRRNQQGMTLIEIMVALVISIFLLSGLIQVFVSSKQTYRLQDAAARVQENGRFALHFLIKDIRMADFWGCMGSFGDVNNHLNPGADNPFDGMTGGIAGTDNDGLNGSDTLTLFGGYGSGITVTGHAVAAASFSVPLDTPVAINQFDYMLVSDCTKADLSQRTNVNNLNAAVTGNTGVGTPGNATKPGIAYSEDDGATLYEFRSTVYSLGTGASGEPALFRTFNGGAGQELVEGVEDMQILYGEDTDNDQAANRYVPAGTAGLVMDNVVAIRVVLTVRSAEDSLTSTQNNGDYRLRRTFTTTTAIRNRVNS